MTPFDAHRLYVGGLAPPKRHRRGFAWASAVVGILCLAMVALGAVTVFHRSERCLQIMKQVQHVNASAWIDECAR